jgi:D-lactate dehydrogenase
MKVAVYSTKSYDREYLDRFNEKAQHQLAYFEASLNANTAILAKGYDALCLFVNDKADSEIMKELADNGIKLIALRCAGFNNIDLVSAKKYSIKVVRVPAYSQSV